jgi:hypothetical protein
MSIDLDDPIALMLVAAAALERSGAECAAYGGLALGMYGEPRETRDADFAVMGVDLERARFDLADLGVEVVIAFSNVRFGGCDVSRLSLVGGSQVNTVDLVTPRSPRFDPRSRYPRALRETFPARITLTGTTHRSCRHSQ